MVLRLGRLTAKAAGWSWRIGASASHSGYQNPFAAYVLAKEKAFKPASPNATRDWSTSLGRQLEFYRWLQSAEGGMAGGATNSWRGRYAVPPAGTTTFYKMAYDEAPVYADPPSNEWFGFQAWTMDRVAQLYYVTGDAHAKIVLDRWVKWVLANTKLGKDGDFAIPSTLQWTGQPQLNWNEKTQNWNGNDAGYNKTLHVKVKDHSQDVGVTGALARTLLFYSAKSGDHAAARLAKELLDRMWKKYWTPKGVASEEARVDYKRFGDPIFVPADWQGRDAQWRPHRAQLHLHKHSLEVQDRSRVAQGGGVFEGRSAAQIHLPPFLGASGRCSRQCEHGDALSERHPVREQSQGRKGRQSQEG